MVLITDRTAPDEMHECPVFGRKIDDGLCFEVANIGNDSLMLSPEETPACGWDEAHKICSKCPYYC